jgi:DNA polymerase-1
MSTVDVVISSAGNGVVRVTDIDSEGAEPASETMRADALAGYIAKREAERPRWVWNSTARWYPGVLARGTTVARCVDLTLSHAIIRASELTDSGALADDGWRPAEAAQSTASEGVALFEMDEPQPGDAAGAGSDVDEHRRQLAAIASSAAPARLRLLLAAESAGSLVAAEMRFAGMPWRADVHDALLTDLLGERVPHGSRPTKMERLADRIRAALDAPLLNPDSQSELLRALRRTGLQVSSTRAWELRELRHPAIGPLLEYKKLARLLSANGWAWMDAWIDDGRFHPDYVPGGVVTGRWATNGGGALQLPKQIRAAVVADPGWKLVVADAAQLEPRVLAGLSADRAMAAAGRGTDLYDGIVASGAVDTRAHAKIAMLGAMYGATTGDSGRLVPALARAYPRAIALVEHAARAGERGEVVTSRLGRSSPRPAPSWFEAQSRAYQPGATAADERQARSRARDWGRFTRNFVVQASAAEWALCWMAELRNRLAALEGAADAVGRAPEPFSRRPHLVFFLHDEVMVHTPAALAEHVAAEIRASADSAGRLLFQDFPIEFPLSVAIVDDYASAK